MATDAISTSRVHEIAQITPESFMEVWSIVQMSMNTPLEKRPLFIVEHDSTSAVVIFYAQHSTFGMGRFSVTLGCVGRSVVSTSVFTLRISEVGTTGLEFRTVCLKQYVMGRGAEVLSGAELMAETIDAELGYPHD